MVGGLARNGQLVFVSDPNDKIRITPLSLLMSGRSIAGFSSGNIEEAIDFSVAFDVLPMVEVFPINKAAEAYERMMTSKVHFRAVLTMEV